jgi:hypothetical protein
MLWLPERNFLFNVLMGGNHRWVSYLVCYLNCYKLHIIASTSLTIEVVFHANKDDTHVFI